jgi:hypothetical protein
MDDYPYATLRADGYLCCDRLHHPSFPSLLQDVLDHFGFTGRPAYHGRLYHEFGHGRCEVHVDIPPHPSDPSLTAWFTMATGDDIDVTLERTAYLALTEFYEHHMSNIAGTPIALFPIWYMGNPTWSARFAAACDTACQTYHAGWAFMARYACHVSSLHQEVTTAGTHQRMCLEEYDHQVEAKDRPIADLRNPYTCCSRKHNSMAC